MLSRRRTGRAAVPRAVAAASLLVCTASGCGSIQTSAKQVANQFHEAVGAEDWSTACNLLAPQTRGELEQSSGEQCSRALEQEHLPAAGAITAFSGFGTMAQVSFEEDTVFVAEFLRGWKVMAAGCTPVTGRPYDCRVKA